MKKIIACSDGTWRKPGATDKGIDVETNVEKIFKLIAPTGKDGVMQCKLYDQGVGSGYSLRDKIIGGMTGAGIDKNIKDIYTFLVLTYEAGDEVYLFGYSRGAYTARSLAGFVRNCGILKPQFLHLVDKAYELYRDRNIYTAPDSDMMISFRNQYSQANSKIKFIGVWDTVGSLGIPLPANNIFHNKRYDFHDVTLSSHVDYAYHALAIDEKRKLFEPTLWKKSQTVLKDPSHPQKMEQRWFTGVHGNIGGGYAEAGLSDITLAWMMDKAGTTGLEFEKSPESFEINPLCKIRNSYVFPFWLLGPLHRTITLKDPGTNQAIDKSVWERFHKDASYRPKSLNGIEIQCDF